MTREIPTEIVLCINSGSSSLKYAVYRVHAGGEECLCDGAIEQVTDYAQALAECFVQLGSKRAPEPTLIAHRIVHGGPRHVAPALIDAALVSDLRTLVPLAPLHLPAAIAGIEAAQARLPSVRQVAAFDTAFHARMPELARRLPIPERFYAAGVRRYGFHGLSFEYAMSTLGDPPPSRVIVAHLGNGSSLVAVKDGVGIDTTMGLTPLGGVMMGTRSGDLDPGVLLYLAREHGLSTAELERLMAKESGLLAIGGTADVKQLLLAAPRDARARLALAMFGYAVRKAIGGLSFALGGLDVLVFTGGIGEHAPQVRSDACQGLESFGICLDPERNEANAPEVQTPQSRVQVRVVTANEDLMLARHAYRAARTALDERNTL